MSENGGYGRVTISWGGSPGEGETVSFGEQPDLGTITALVPLDGSHIVRIRPDGSGELLQVADEELGESE